VPPPPSPPSEDRATNREADLELLARLRSGDRDAFDTIFRQWYAKVVRATEVLLRDRAVAEELVQDVMLELWRRRETLDPRGSAQAYLYQATRNRALNHLRHLQVQRRSAVLMDREESREARASSAVVAHEMDVALRRGMDALSPRCREVFELSRVRGLKYAEIAEALDISIKTVEAQMGKALRTLREHLAPWLPDSDRL
jgi:RNA polymerase sigma-70 factor (ECF subfamily)